MLQADKNQKSEVKKDCGQVFKNPENEKKFAIRFGLGAIKAVGFAMIESVVKERTLNGKFSNIYNFVERINPRSVNKKSIEALAKAGAFECLQQNRRQIAESFDVLSSYASTKSQEATSNQMNLFGSLADNHKPELKKVASWDKTQRLQKEFEAFGFFLNEHPLDDSISDLRKRGVIFSNRPEDSEIEDGDLVKMAGVVAASKHRSGSRGRFAYMTISDPFGIFEVMIFDEALITAARDLLTDGSIVALKCLIRKDEGGVRISVLEVQKLEEFIKITTAQNEDFEDIKKQISRKSRNYKKSPDNKDQKQGLWPKNVKKEPKTTKIIQTTKIIPLPKIILSEADIIIKSRNQIFALKAELSKFIAPAETKKFTTVFLVVPCIADNKKVTKIKLAQKYFIDDSDLLKLRTCLEFFLTHISP
jgi:DNA polymerase III alpha subunit